MKQEIELDCVQSKIVPHWEGDGKILALQLHSPKSGKTVMLSFFDPKECKMFKVGKKYRLKIDEISNPRS